MVQPEVSGSPSRAGVASYHPRFSRGAIWQQKYVSQLIANCPEEAFYEAQNMKSAMAAGTKIAIAIS
jgi:hypothetical protein